MAKKYLLKRGTFINKNYLIAVVTKHTACIVDETKPSIWNQNYTKSSLQYSSWYAWRLVYKNALGTD